MSALRWAHQRALFLVFAALLLLLGTAFSGASSASAAPPYDTVATIDTLTFVDEAVTEGYNTELSGTWSVADNPTGSVGFSIDLPEGLRGLTDSFPLLEDDSVTQMGQCTVTTTQLYCDLDPDYVSENPLGLHGTFNFWVNVETEVTEETVVTYDFTGVDGETSITVVPGYYCDEDCEYRGEEGQKYGYYYYEDNELLWVIHVPNPVGGLDAGQEITLTDLIGPNQEITDYRVNESTELGIDSQGRENPINFDWVSADRITEGSDPFSLTWTAVQGSYYVVYIWADATDFGASGTYTNAAEIEVSGEETVTVENEVVRQGGGGTGIGTNVGRFAITKSVEGTATMDDTTTYTVNYVVTTPDGEEIEGTGTLTDGSRFTSPTYPRGSTVVLTEVTPTDSDSVTWSEPVFSQNDFTLVGGQETAVTLTNTATLNTDTFSAQKVIEGDGAANVDDDATFVLDYTYPAGDGYAAGDGSLTLGADGESVESEDLPIGAELTFTEATPADVPGATWDGATISPETLTIGSEEATSVVTVTNDISLDLGGFSVTKSLSGSGQSQVPDGTVFTVNYSYPAGDGFAAGGGTITVEAGQTASVDGLPAGAVVTLSEVRATDPEGATWGDPVFDQASFTVVEDAVVAIDLDNPITLNTGQFSITKAVDGTGEELVGNDVEFLIDYSYPAGDGYEADSGTLTVTADGTVASPLLPYGAVVTLSEQAPPSVENAEWTAAEFSQTEVTIGDNTLVELDLTNTATLDTATFSASKAITGDGAGNVEDDATFTLNYTYPAGQGFAAGEGSLTLSADGEVVESDELPVGAVLTFTEATPADVPAATWDGATISPQTLTIGSEEATSVVTVTNEISLDLGGFSVTKSLSGDGASLAPEGTVFTVNYSYPAGDGFDAGSGSLEVAAGETSTVEGLPAGAVVTLDEVRATDPEGATWGDPVFDQASFTVVQDAIVEIDLDNPITRDTGQFAVTKAVDGTGESLVGDDVEFTVDYSYPAGEGYEAGSGTLTVTADDTVASPLLPYGAVVTLSEATPATVDGAEWTAAEFSQTELTVGDGTVVEIDLVNTLDTVPPTPSTPDTPGSPGGLLPDTGSPASLALLAAALAATAIGGGLVISGRRTRAKADADA